MNTNITDILSAVTKVVNGEATPKIDVNTNVSLSNHTIINFALGLFLVGLLLIIIFIVVFRKTQP